MAEQPTSINYFVLQCLTILALSRTSNAVMSTMSGSSSGVAPWFAALPLTDPRCRNDSCKAFKAGHTASQHQISWASQFLYGHYVTWYYLAFIGLFAAIFAAHTAQDFLLNGRKRSTIAAGSSVVDKAKAAIRSVSYRRVGGRLGAYMGLPSAGIIFWMLLATVAITAMSFAQHPYYRKFRGFGSPPLGVRTGLMAAAFFPLTIALSGKVNLVTVLTGYGYEKLNVWHRYAGWAMFVLSTIHTIPFFYQESREVGPQNLHKKFYSPGALEFSGVPAWALSFGLVAFSLPIFRKHFYELFVQLHILMAIAFLGLCFWHFNQEGDSWDYLWATIAIWLFQLVVRMFWKTSAFKITETWFSGLPTTARTMPGNMVRLEVFVPEHWTWRPGQHVFLRFPRLNPLDNHPFTIASIPRSKPYDDKSRSTNVMTFLVRKHGGSTKRMAEYLAKTPDAQLSTIVDGPYGTIARRYERCADKLVLIAGGNGVTSCMPWLLHLSQAMHQGECITRNVHLIWVVRHSAHITWVVDDIREALANAPKGSIDVRVYITDERLGSNSDSDGIEELKGQQRVRASSFTEVNGVTIKYEGRPRLRSVLESTVGGDRTAIVGCGPESMKIDLSNAVARLQAKVFRGEAKEVMLHTETFDW